MKHLRIFPALFLALLIGVAACSNNAKKKSMGTQEKEAVSTTKDFSGAFYVLMHLAEQGDAGAQYRLGLKYYAGDDITQNYKEALKWLTLSAKQGHADAQFHLGMMYKKGHGVTQNYKKTLKWYALAAKQEHARAQTSLGVMYNTGEGVSQDFKKAVNWFTLAAEQGYVIAQNLLGIMHANGRGVPQSLVLAYMWLDLAVTNKKEIVALPVAIREKIVGMSAELKDDLAKDMTPQQIEKAKELSRECKAKNYQNC